MTDAVAALGRLDILVCNVGGGGSVAPGEETYEEWQRVFALNLWSTTNMVEAARTPLAGTQRCDRLRLVHLWTGSRGGRSGHLFRGQGRPSCVRARHRPAAGQ